MQRCNAVQQRGSARRAVEGESISSCAVDHPWIWGNLTKLIHGCLTTIRAPHQTLALESIRTTKPFDQETNHSEYKSGWKPEMQPNTVTRMLPSCLK
jgi:hypothetical protein